MGFPGRNAGTTHALPSCGSAVEERNSAESAGLVLAAAPELRRSSRVLSSLRRGTQTVPGVFTGWMLHVGRAHQRRNGAGVPRFRRGSRSLPRAAAWDSTGVVFGSCSVLVPRAELACWLIGADWRLASGEFMNSTAILILKEAEARPERTKVSSLE